MSERKPQSYANHGRFDPAYHFFLLPFAMVAFVASVILLIHHIHQSVPHILALLTLLFLVSLLRMRPPTDSRYRIRADWRCPRPTATCRNMLALS